MKFCSIIFLCLLNHIGFSQRNTEALSQKAFNFYSKEQQYDSAIFYYKKIISNTSQKREAYFTYQIANCYSASGKKVEAENYYIKCLSIDKLKNSLGMFQNLACKYLSEIYFEQKRFREALNYLDSSITKYKPFRNIFRCGTGSTIRKMEFALSKSNCYIGLNKKDSAINLLSPLIFRDFDVFYFDDTLALEEAAKLYSEMVFEVMGKTVARKELEKALEKVNYKQVFEKTASGKINSVSVDCFIIFRGIKIYLENGGGYSVEENELFPSFLSKENLIKDFKNSRAYQLIMFEPSQPIALIK
jgi:tetratricopeptide (TPR) repeat protein